MGYGDTTAANDAAADKRTGRIVKLQELALLCGVSVNTSESWVRRGMPLRFHGEKGVPHKCDTAQCILWLIRQERERVDATVKTDPEDLKNRREKARTEISELDLAKRKGELVEIELVEELFSGLVMNARSRLLALPSRVSPLLTGKQNTNEIKRIIDDAVCDTLTELAGTDPAELLARGGEIEFSSGETPE